MSPQPALELQHVTKTFGQGETEVVAVRDASLRIKPGEIVLVMGPSGSGKTTLLSMCGALLRPTGGSIWIDGTEITALDESKLPDVRLTKLGFIFQSFNLLSNLTALENVRLVMEAAGVATGAASKRAGQVLGELRMDKRLDYLPEKLSGGEKQRVAIARALANDAPIILADEPTGNLDSRTGYHVMHLLENLAKEGDKTVLCVTHDQRIRDVADQIFWLEDGMLSERPPEDRAEVVEDPVCGMRIDAARAADSRSIDGRELYFCSDICVEKFDREPPRYIGARSGGSSSTFSTEARRRQE